MCVVSDEDRSSDAGPLNLQSLLSLRRYGNVLATVEPPHLGTIHVPSERPPAVFQWTGNARQVDQDELAAETQWK